MLRKLILLLLMSSVMLSGCSGGKDEVIPASDWESEYPLVYET